MHHTFDIVEHRAEEHFNHDHVASNSRGQQYLHPSLDMQRGIYGEPHHVEPKPMHHDSLNLQPHLARHHEEARHGRHHEEPHHGYYHEQPHD